MANRLAAESSPYLRKHADQAIDWRPWGEEAFALARAEDKPILVSIGYLACFWCHVMAEEAYSDPRVVAALTDDFVAIKVDREERPDVDRGILDGLARLGARTGWPINAFSARRRDALRRRQLLPTRAAPRSARLSRRPRRCQAQA